MYTALIVGCGTIAGLYDDNGKTDSIVSHAAGYRNHDMFDLSGCVDSNKKTVERFAELQQIAHFDTNLVTILNAVQPDIEKAVKRISTVSKSLSLKEMNWVMHLLSLEKISHMMSTHPDYQNFVAEKEKERTIH